MYVLLFPPLKFSLQSFGYLTVMGSLSHWPWNDKVALDRLLH